MKCQARAITLVLVGTSSLLILLGVKLGLSDGRFRGVRDEEVPSFAAAANKAYDETSSVYRYLQRRAHGINESEWKRMVSWNEFDQRRAAFYAQTVGVADITAAQRDGYCVADSTSAPPLPAAVRQALPSRDDRLRRGQSLSQTDTVEGEVPLVTIRADKELGYNLEGMLPFAYYLHLHGCLNETHSYPGAAPFFFFDPKFKIFESPNKHSGDDYKEDEGVRIHIYKFNTWGHTHPWMRLWWLKSAEDRKAWWNPLRTDQYPVSGLAWPPFRDFYSNTMFKPRGVQKPLAIVAGKHNKQWHESKPVNTFARPHELDQILRPLVEHGYIVIYNRVRQELPGDAGYDRASDPKDYEFIHSTYADNDVITFEDLWAATCQRYGIEPTDLTALNMLQLATYAQADIFIDTQGGASVISSLFSGDHLIFHQKGHELIHKDTTLIGAWAYHNWWRHAGGRFYIFDNVTELRSFLQTLLHQRSFKEQPSKANASVPTAAA